MLHSVCHMHCVNQGRLPGRYSCQLPTACLHGTWHGGAVLTLFYWSSLSILLTRSGCGKFGLHSDVEHFVWLSGGSMTCTLSSQSGCAGLMGSVCVPECGLALALQWHLLVLGSVCVCHWLWLEHSVTGTCPTRASSTHTCWP